MTIVFATKNPNLFIDLMNTLQKQNDLKDPCTITWDKNCINCGECQI